MSSTQPTKKLRAWIWKLPMGALVLMLAALTGAILLLDNIALDQINGLLQRHLAAGGRLASIDIDLAAGRIELGGVTINAPEGHGNDPLLALATLVLDVDPVSLIGDTIVVEKLTLKGMRVSLVRDGDGQTGLDALLKSDGTSMLQQASDKPEESRAADGKSDRKALLFDTIRSENGTITYRDSALIGKPMVFPLQEITFQASLLRLFDDSHAKDPASITVTGQLEQPGDLPAASFGLVVRMSSVGQGVPAINAQSCLIGLKLDTLGALLPPATRTALGGDGLDAGMALALNHGRIKLDALILTDRNVRYDTIRMRGALNAPEVQIAPVLSGVFRVTDGVLNLGKSGLGVGLHLAESSVDAARGAGSGVFKAGKTFLGGLFDSGKGLLTWDHEQVKAGLVDSTAGTLGDSLDAVGGTGNIAGLGLDRSLSQLTGSTAVRQWDQDIFQRFQKAMQGAREALTNMAYPPVTD